MDYNGFIFWALLLYKQPVPSKICTGCSGKLLSNVTKLKKVRWSYISATDEEVELLLKIAENLLRIFSELLRILYRFSQISWDMLRFTQNLLRILFRFSQISWDMLRFTQNLLKNCCDLLRIAENFLDLLRTFLNFRMLLSTLSKTCLNTLYELLNLRK